jgi:CRP-like cAMP-binding protein
MGTSLIIESITRHIALEKEDKEAFLSMLIYKKLARREFLVRANETSKHTAFVTTGCLRSYSTDKNGFEHILQFASPGWWIADLNSVINRQPGKLNIEALVESEVLLLSREHQEKLFAIQPRFERFFRILLENSIAANSARLLDYMGMSAEERYVVFTRRYPGLTLTLSQKQIASYIGVTPEFLSKIKADLLKKK